MKYRKLFALNVMALCCVLGLFSKKMISPLTNIITDSLHIPGGISTGFSIMFLVIAAELVQTSKCGVMMGAVQGLLALAMGRMGSMGVLSPVGYIMPGLAIDLVYRLCGKTSFSRTDRMVIANGLGAVMASVTANIIVFHLRGAVLCLYLAVSATSGASFGFLGAGIAGRLSSVYNQYIQQERTKPYEKV